MFTWGRRMSKKLELLRRDSKNSSDLISPADAQVSTSNTLLDTLGRSNSKNKTTQRPTSLINPDTFGNLQAGTKTFRTFFHRIGSTGMLNHKSASLQSRSSSKSTLDSTSQLYRSSSTSQLNSPSYVKTGDPSNCVSLAYRTKSISDRTRTAPVKSSSCDDIAKAGGESTKKGFPYAFLRSKLSVLPEENGGSVINQKRVMENSNAAAGHFLYASSSSEDSPTRSNETTALNSSRNSSIRLNSSDECSSNFSNSPSLFSTIDWEPPTYQRLNSCLSSNESGYDSDGRHVEEPGASNALLENAQKSQMESQSRNRLSTTEAVESTTIRRRFRQIKLHRGQPDDVVGVVMTPKFYHLNEVDMEVRYFIADIETNSLAYM